MIHVHDYSNSQKNHNSPKISINTYFGRSFLNCPLTVVLSILFCLILLKKNNDTIRKSRF